MNHFILEDFATTSGFSISTPDSLLGDDSEVTVVDARFGRTFRPDSDAGVSLGGTHWGIFERFLKLEIVRFNYNRRTSELTIEVDW